MNNMLEELDMPIIVKKSLNAIEVKYLNFNSEIKKGIIICNNKLSDSLIKIFNELLYIQFPIEMISPISNFNWDDKISVQHNNTSCFNWRKIIGSSKLSDHAIGCAIDINPIQNPWIHPSAHKIEGREYNINKKGTIMPNIVTIFKNQDFQWGGDWNMPDYQHFYKTDINLKEKIKYDI